MISVAHEIGREACCENMYSVGGLQGKGRMNSVLGVAQNVVTIGGNTEQHPVIYCCRKIKKMRYAMAIGGGAPHTCCRRFVGVEVVAHRASTT